MEIINNKIWVDILGTTIDVDENTAQKIMKKCQGLNFEIRSDDLKIVIKRYKYDFNNEQ